MPRLIVGLVDQEVGADRVFDKFADVIWFPFFGFIPACLEFHSRLEKTGAFKRKVLGCLLYVFAEAAEWVREKDGVLQMAMAHKIAEACYPLDT